MQKTVNSCFRRYIPDDGDKVTTLGEGILLMVTGPRTDKVVVGITTEVRGQHVYHITLSNHDPGMIMIFNCVCYEFYY